MTGSLGPRPIHHIGILVPDLESAVRTWSAALGYRFSPVGRYRTEQYVDRSDPRPHPHDARFVMSREGPPHIELLEVTGNGTHGPDRVGVHHLALTGIADLDAERARIEALGLPVDGENRDDLGRLLLFFAHLAETPLELVSQLPGPLLAEDGTPLPVDPATGRPSVLLLPDPRSP